jgi:uncharacterized protein (DUF1330 family)
MSRPITVAAVAVLSAILTGWNYSAVARGGHGGFRGGGFMVPGAGRLPAYVVIDVSATNDKQTFNAMVANAGAGLVPFGGHIVVDADGPTAWDGQAPQHLVIIAFDSLEQAQAWKSSDSFKAFDADRRLAATSRAFVFEGIPNAVPSAGLHGGGRLMRYDPKPFEEIIKKRDQDLRRIKDICKGC